MEESALSTLVAYKFLRPGALGPFSGYAWPAPAPGEAGEWVTADTAAGPCRDGVHACERRHLPLWICEELWEVELGGEVERRRHKLRAPRGRLLRRVEAWSSPTARSFARACAVRAAEHAAAAPAEAAARAIEMAAGGERRARAAEASEEPYGASQGGAVCAYIAAMTAFCRGGMGGYDAEREWQARWLARELKL